MVDAYRSDAWQLLFASVAAASAALTGLLFVGLSMNLRRVVGTPEHLARARESFGQLLSLLVLSVILLIPGQNRLLLGTELIGLGAILAGVSLFLHKQTFKRIKPGRTWQWGVRIAIFHIATLAIPIAGVSLTRGHYGAPLVLFATFRIVVLL